MRRNGNRNVPLVKRATSSQLRAKSNSYGQLASKALPLSDIDTGRESSGSCASCRLTTYSTYSLITHYGKNPADSRCPLLARKAGLRDNQRPIRSHEVSTYLTVRWCQTSGP